MTSSAHQPIRISASFWERADVTAALRAREVKTLFRLVRQFGGGVSQTRIGCAIGLAQGRVSEIMSGRRQVESAKLLERIADGLNMPDTAREAFGLARKSAALDLSSGTATVVPAPLPAACSPTERPQEGEQCITVPGRTSDGKVVLVSVSRRVFLQGFAVATMGFSATRPGNSAIPPDVKPLSYYQRVRQLLVDNDNAFGPIQVIAQAQQQLESLQELLVSQRGQDRTELLRMRAQFAELCGWLHQDVGNYRAAQYWLDRALQWSHTAHDPDLTVYILARKSQLAGDMHDPTEAVGVAEAALGMARPHSRLAAVAATYAAHGHSLNGDKTGCVRAYDRAHELLQQVESDRPSPWAVWLDASYIGVQRAASLAQLGDYHAAVDSFQGAISALPDGYRRDRGVYLAREAKAHAGNRDAEQAAVVGLRALSIGAETGSARIATELADLSKKLAPWANTPSVRRFHEAIHSTPALTMPAPNKEECS